MIEILYGQFIIRRLDVWEFQQFPLSPIPSMSNLLETPLVSPLYCDERRWLEHHARQCYISPVDIKGYAQLRSLRRHCRPVLSESAAELYDIVDRMELLSFLLFRPRKSSFGDSRKMKVRT
ncbi:hypothetical protein EVAR_71284_1 [Eumeta japonica]|uniref:Uncharacterized protein n=1 Tax=Eumeta variegata TaxID=151549 RepID=A0A4C1THM0_EUMVA|nr:hypothetical protein EVAR_71284_1 [Eumeta japonica]